MIRLSDADVMACLKYKVGDGLPIEYWPNEMFHANQGTIGTSGKINSLSANGGNERGQGPLQPPWSQNWDQGRSRPFIPNLNGRRPACADGKE